MKFLQELLFLCTRYSYNQAVLRRKRHVNDLKHLIIRASLASPVPGEFCASFARVPAASLSAAFAP